MIKSIAIENFKSLKKAAVELPFFGAIVGKNAAGKTNLIQAIELIVNLSRESTSEFVQEGFNIVPYELFNDSSKPIHVSLAFETSNEEDFRLDVTFEIRNGGQRPPRLAITKEVLQKSGHGIIYKRDGEIIVDGQENRLPLALTDNKLVLAFYDSKESLVAKETVQRVHIIDPEVDIERHSIGSAEGNDKSLANLILRLEQKDKESFDNFSKIIKKLIPSFAGIQELKLSGSISKDSPEKAQFLVLFEEMDLKNQLSAKSISAGNFRTMFILAKALSLNNCSLIIEEIENGMHPIRTKAVMEHLLRISQKKNVQILFTTHSPFVINNCSPHQIVRVTRDANNGTQLTLLGKSDEVTQIESFLSKDGQLTDFLDADW